jgi:hypothetical protein
MAVPNFQMYSGHFNVGISVMTVKNEELHGWGQAESKA